MSSRSLTNPKSNKPAKRPSTSTSTVALAADTELRNPAPKTSSTTTSLVDALALRFPVNLALDRQGLISGAISSVGEELYVQYVSSRSASVSQSVCTADATTSDLPTMSDVDEEEEELNGSTAWSLAPEHLPPAGQDAESIRQYASPPRNAAARCVGMFCPAAMENLYYIAHNASQALELRGFKWRKTKKKKKGNKKTDN